jgi:N-formylglutamate amidohydrolase
MTEAGPSGNPGAMSLDAHPCLDRPFVLRRPKPQTMAVVFASPHSGTDYPASFLAASRLALGSLRRSEDCWVDELFAAAPAHGAPLLAARFPRSFVDPNREERELDPHMFEDALPAGSNIASPRVAAGLGVIPRVVATGEEIYARKLGFAEAARRIEGYWRPYHRALAAIMAETRRSFGFCVLIDCHSMPSAGGPLEREMGWDRVDFVLGDCRGGACAPALTQHVEASLRRMGYSVARNNPYAGGYVTQHYGRPAEGVHALQIEINRGLYLDEASLERGPGFARLAEDIGRLIAALAPFSLGLAAAAE